MPAAPPGPPTGGRPVREAGVAAGFTGRTIARCRIGDRLGRGVTSHVFRAFYEPLSRDIAVKILSREMAGSVDMRARFLAEAKAVAKVSHENIVKVLDVVEDQGLFCILMELVPGPTLQDMIDDEGVLPPFVALRIAGQIARALEAAHDAKIVHRDVKPANVMVVGAPGHEIVKVVDFGLAAQQEMNRVGTPLFMSPEAAQGKRIDEKSDVYALGVCVYLMLTGTLPFTGSSVKEILAAHVNLEMEPPSSRRPQLGKVYDDLLKRLLVKSKGYRPSADEAAELLEDLGDDLEEREQGIRRQRRRKAKKRVPVKKSNPTLWAGLGLGALVLIAIAALATSGGKAPVVTETPKPTTTSTPTVVVDPLQKLLDETLAWADANPGNPAEAVTRLKAIESQYPGTKWAKLASARRAAAEDAVRMKNEEAAIKEGLKRKEEAADAKRRAQSNPKEKIARIDELSKAFKFEDAAGIAEGLGDLPADVDSDAWDRRALRLDYLRDNFVKKLNQGFADRKPPIKAKLLYPAAKENETLVGANTDGAVASDGTTKRTLKWSEAKREGFYQARGGIVDGALDTEKPEDCVLLAVLAYEMGAPEKTWRKRRTEASRDENLALKLDAMLPK